MLELLHSPISSSTSLKHNRHQHNSTDSFICITAKPWCQEHISVELRGEKYDV